MISDKGKCMKLKTNDVTWYDPLKYDSDNSDVTANYGDMFPDEKIVYGVPIHSTSNKFYLHCISCSQHNFTFEELFYWS